MAKTDNVSDSIAVIDFGGQYAHLIGRRIRELKVYSEVITCDKAPGALKNIPNLKGIIFSGGPSSIYEENSPKIDKTIYSFGLPILGICYGHQLIASQFGGVISKGALREYGRTFLDVIIAGQLLYGVKQRTTVWMSHGDQVIRLPTEFIELAQTRNARYAAFSDRTEKIFGVQFHPEVVHTVEGKKILKNFLFRICCCRPSWKPSSFIKQTLENIASNYDGSKVICAVSGGLDSTVTAILVKKIAKNNLVCVFVNNGLLRKDESEAVISSLKQLGLNPVYVDASETFLNRLKGVTDPEEKRKVVGATFIEVFKEVSKKEGPLKYLAQGTLYPDVIESAKTGGLASTIKTHHNVGGLPLELSYYLIEPLRFLYKDEVRKAATVLGLPDTIVKRHPFPGPGLSVRIIGEVTKEKLRICREASVIVEEELKVSGIYNRIWQAFAYVGDDRAVAVLGDSRLYGYIVTVKVVTSKDGMTADWVKLPSKVLDRMSARITNEVNNVSSISYCISSKPPATIEPQ
ncbi:MAG: glutamine-hydrolyzing GMP synthase [Nitrososphaeria archaeon]|jgi:GMP synthase (glutamine-hydrolysing)